MLINTYVVPSQLHMKNLPFFILLVYHTRAGISLKKFSGPNGKKEIQKVIGILLEQQEVFKSINSSQMYCSVQCTVYMDMDLRSKVPFCVVAHLCILP